MIPNAVGRAVMLTTVCSPTEKLRNALADRSCSEIIFFVHGERVEYSRLLLELAQHPRADTLSLVGLRKGYGWLEELGVRFELLPLEYFGLLEDRPIAEVSWEEEDAWAKEGVEVEEVPEEVDEEEQVCVEEDMKEE